MTIPPRVIPKPAHMEQVIALMFIHANITDVRMNCGEHLLPHSSETKCIS